MNNKSYWITFAAVLMVMALIMTACASITQSTTGGLEAGQEEPAPEQPVEAPPEQEPVEPPPEEAPIEEPVAPAPTQAPVDSTGNVTTSQGSQTGIVIVLLLILVMIGLMILVVANRGRGGQSQPQPPDADASTTPPTTPVDDTETDGYQNP